MKPWYRRKTLWAGVALIVTGIGEIVTTQDYQAGLTTIVSGLAVIFVRDAIERSGPAK